MKNRIRGGGRGREGRGVEDDGGRRDGDTGDASVPKDAHTPRRPPMAGNRAQRFTKFPLTTCSPPLLLFTSHDVSTATKCSVEPIPLARGLPGTAILHATIQGRRRRAATMSFRGWYFLFLLFLLSFLRRVVEFVEFYLVAGSFFRLSEEGRWNWVFGFFLF